MIIYGGRGGRTQREMIYGGTDILYIKYIREGDTKENDMGGQTINILYVCTMYKFPNRDKQTNGQTDGQTDGQTQPHAPLWLFNRDIIYIINKCPSPPLPQLYKIISNLFELMNYHIQYVLSPPPTLLATHTHALAFVTRYVIYVVWCMAYVVFHM